MNKYEFTGETREFSGRTLRRIRALVTGRFTVIGEVGGWIDSEINLSQDGDAWVSGAAQVSGDARVSGDAWVSGDARVSGATDLVMVGPIGSRRATLSIYADAQIGVRFSTGCFSGSRDELVAAVALTHESGPYRAEYDAAIAFADAWIGAHASHQEAA